jgi:hypothetical protein
MEHPHDSPSLDAYGVNQGAGVGREVVAQDLENIAGLVDVAR